MIADLLVLGDWQSPSWIPMRGSEAGDGDTSYSETDFDNYVEIIFREVAEELGTKYKDVKDILYGRNIEFFECKARIFSSYDSIDKGDDDYAKLTSKLKIPCTYSIGRLSRVERFFEDFMSLDIKDKIELLEKLDKVQIELPDEYSFEHIDSQDVLVKFGELRKVQKYEVLRKMINVNITEVLEE